MSKEFSIGALRARDNFEMSRSDIVAKMVERMEIYAVACEKMARNESVRPELRNKLVQHLYACFCELSDFLINVIGIEIYNPVTGRLISVELFDRVYLGEAILASKLSCDKKQHED